MRSFTRDDGRVLQVVEGYRRRILGERATYSPREDWTEERYTEAAEKKLQRTRRFLAEFESWGGRIEGARVLDVACGDAINCLQIALQPVEQVVGIDLELPLIQEVSRTERSHALTAAVWKQAGLAGEPDEIMTRLPVRLLNMDATAMQFEDESFDFLMSRSAIEHIMPVEKALTEMARVVRPGGLIHLSTDPYYSPRGCHKTGVVDIPWAHARLTLEEYRRFVRESEGEEQAERRCHRLNTLNQFTIREWRDLIEAGPFEVLEWREEPSPSAEPLLEEFPDVRATVLPGVDYPDLINGRLRVWLRKRAI